LRSPEIKSIRDLRRGQIVAEARAILAEEGLAALTIGTLEKRLPFSRGVITHHFANKEDIVEAVLDDALADIDAATRLDVAAGDSIEDKVRAVLRTKVRGFLAAVEAARVLLAFWGRLGTDPRSSERNAALFQRYRNQSARLLRDGQQQGIFRADLDVDAMAGLLVGQVLGIVLQSLFDPDHVDVDRMIDAATRAIMAASIVPPHQERENAPRADGRPIG
jgi:AcrR family transcriptional regulator